MNHDKYYHPERIYGHHKKRKIIMIYCGANYVIQGLIAKALYL